jgi:hypothetical protein
MSPAPPLAAVTVDVDRRVVAGSPPSNDKESLFMSPLVDGARARGGPGALAGLGRSLVAGIEGEEGEPRQHVGAELDDQVDPQG